MIDLATTVKQAAAGDERAWEALVTAYRGMLENIGRSYRLDPEQRQDAIQDTWLALLGDIGRLRNPERVGSWLAKTMHRTCLRARQRSDREIPRDAVAMCLLADLACDDVDDRLLANEQHDLFAKALNQLSPRQRQVVTALAGDESYRDLGSSLNMPIGSIGPTRARALHQLRTSLTAVDDYGLEAA